MSTREDIIIIKDLVRDDETLILQPTGGLLNNSSRSVPELPATWTVELWLENLAATPISLLITDDTVLGRETLDASPDFDLTPIGGWIAGVSRHHVLLRPTPHHLFVIDLKSSRGTYHNGVQLSSTVARQLRNNDTLQLGALTFRVKLGRPVAVH